MEGDTISNEFCQGPILIMGIGNMLLGDEGVGVHAIRELEKIDLPDSVRLLDAGIAFIDAVSHMEGIHKLIVIDAIKGGKKPGTVYHIQVNPDSYSCYSATLHGVSVLAMMTLLQHKIPDKVSVIGVEPDTINWATDISDTVKKAMPLLMETVLNEIKINNEANAE